MKIKVYMKPTHTDQHLLFDSHHPQEHKLGVIITLHHQAENLPTTAEIKDEGCKHLATALKPHHCLKQDFPLQMQPFFSTQWLQLLLKIETFFLISQIHVI